MAERPRIRRRLVVAGAVAILTGGGAVAAVTAAGTGSGAATTTVTKAHKTAKATTASIIKTDKVDGLLEYDATTALPALRSGTLTAVADEKTTVDFGQTLWSIDGKLTVLLEGAAPAYRELSTSSSDGADIRQLEQALVDLGYGSGVTVDDTFSSATKTAVKRWEKALGIDEDGVVQLGQAQFAPSPVRVESHAVSLGSQVQTGATVATVTSTTRVVTVSLALTKADEAPIGTDVTIDLPDGKTTKGTVTKTTRTTTTAAGGATASSGSSSTSTSDTISIVVSLADANAVTKFDNASVKVHFTTSRKDNLLTVPVAALLALSGGGYAVEVPDGATTKLVTVKTGASDTSRIEVTGDLKAGTDVVVPG